MMSQPRAIAQGVAGPCGRLEAILEEPAGKPLFDVVIAHPHPLYGGTMENATTRILARRLVVAGGRALRFNFRGVGGSDGHFDHGRGELEDLRAAERHLTGPRSERPLWLAGYSFGAALVLQRSSAERDEPAPACLLALAPPVARYDLRFLTESATPLALVCGDRDDLTPRATVEDLVAEWPGVVACRWLEGQGHDLGAIGAPRELEEALDGAIRDLLDKGASREER